MTTRTHHIECRIYYEDTDACGIVYHANYLRFAERARTEMLRACGLNRASLIPGENLTFVVRHIDIDYKAPARLDDLLIVQSHINKMSGSSFTMIQDVMREGTALVRIKAVVVCVDLGEMKPLRIPALLREALEPFFVEE